MLGDKSAQSLARFHAAEHAVINGYYDLQRVPTIEEIHEYSSYSYRCGSLNGFNHGLLLFGFALARLIPGLWFLLAMLVACFVDFIFVKTSGLTFMEFLVLDKPSDTEYAVVIKAMEESVKNVDLSPYLSDLESILDLASVIGIIIEENICDDGAVTAARTMTNVNLANGISDSVPKIWKPPLDTDKKCDLRGSRFV